MPRCSTAHSQQGVFTLSSQCLHHRAAPVSTPLERPLHSDTAHPGHNAAAILPNVFKLPPPVACNTVRWHWCCKLAWRCHPRHHPPQPPNPSTQGIFYVLLHNLHSWHSRRRPYCKGQGICIFLAPILFLFTSFTLFALGIRIAEPFLKPHQYHLTCIGLSSPQLNLMRKSYPYIKLQFRYPLDLNLPLLQSFVFSRLE